MAVVINEFEIVAEPPPSAEGEPAEKKQSPPPPSPLDAERLLRRYQERQARIRAH